jgi:hypothetical protein
MTAHGPRLGEDAVTSSCPKLVPLGLNALPVGRDSRVSDDDDLGTPVSHLNCAQRNALESRGGHYEIFTFDAPQRPRFYMRGPAIFARDVAVYRDCPCWTF